MTNTVYTVVSFENLFDGHDLSRNIDAVHTHSTIGGAIDTVRHIVKCVGHETIFDTLESEKKTQKVLDEIESLLNDGRIFDAKDLFNENSSYDFIGIFETELETK